MNLRVLQRTLEGQNYELLVAHSGEEALAQTLAARPAMILLDIRMPGIDGFEVCRRLQSDARTRDSAIVFMSALDDKQEIVRALEVGAVDYITKPFFPAEVRARVRVHLELRRLNGVLAETNRSLLAANRKLKQDLEAAAKIQQALLPAKAPDLAGYAFAWCYRPCEELAGDALNVFPLSDGQVGAYVLDISGHGVAASLLAVSVTHSIVPRNGAPSVVMDISNGNVDPPSLVATRLNRLYPLSDHDGRYFTIAYGVLNAATGSFRHIAAGHPGPVLIRDQTVSSIENPNFPVGMLADADYNEDVIELLPGDRIYLHSDGILEETDPSGTMFGRQRLHAELLSTRNLPLPESIDSLVGAVVSWRGNDTLSDDVTVLAIERRDPARE
jgi:sigma-B regulation protein RsbU (phosphoserine phosphatase)